MFVSSLPVLVVLTQALQTPFRNTVLHFLQRRCVAAHEKPIVALDVTSGYKDVLPGYPY